MDLFYDSLCELVEDTRRDEPMSRHVTFRTGGPADYFAAPASVRELRAVVTLCREAEKPYFILGNGSNLLVSDKGYRGVVIQVGRALGRVQTAGSLLFAGAGATLASIAARALEAGLTGLEFAAGIPGTVGGAMVMNAGAYDGEMSQVVESVDVLTKFGEEKKLGNKELKLGYRTSCILPMEYIVTGAAFSLRPGDPAGIRAKMDELAARRKEKQPLEFPSAGSTFKRPAGNFAGKLIMEAGLKGFSVGGACVSEKHCGFVVNKGGASSADIMELCRIVKERVREHSGVALELEIRLLGDFS